MKMNNVTPLNDLTSLEAIEVDLKRLLVLVERLKREWQRLPEKTRRANPGLSKFFEGIPTKH